MANSKDSAKIHIMLGLVHTLQVQAGALTVDTKEDTENMLELVNNLNKADAVLSNMLGGDDAYQYHTKVHQNSS